MEILILSLDIRLSLVLCILLLYLIKEHPRLFFSGSLTKVSVLYTLCDIVIQKFHDSWEVLRVPVYAHDAVVFELYIELLVPQIVCPDYEHAREAYFFGLDVRLNILVLVCGSAGDIYFSL